MPKLPPSTAVLLSLAIAPALIGCAAAIERVTTPGRAADLSELWVTPRDIESRNLLVGNDAVRLASGDGPFVVVARDNTGASPGYDVRDQRGRMWSVKLGIEAQPEVTTSRLLWAIGFHQDSLYFLPEWRMEGVPTPQPGARFRSVPPREEVAGDWAWRQNPFVGTRPFRGLIVANLLVNNWDWKTNNNKIYAPADPAGRGARRYVVRDLGASLGRTLYPRLLQPLRLRGFVQGTKNDLEGFERQGFIKSMTEDRVEFDYAGIHRDLIDTVTPADVQWTCQWFSRLSDAQWRDAFRAGGYDDQTAGRYIRKLKEKVAEGLARTKGLEARARPAA